MSTWGAAVSAAAFVGCLAVVATISNGNRSCAEPGTPCNRGELFGDCVELRPVINGAYSKDSPWVPAKCSEPAGDTGAMVAVVEPGGSGTGDMGAEGGGRALSAAQIRDLWVRHGGDPAQANVAAAVARAESGGRPDATNRSNGDGSVDRGLFQINSVHGASSTYDLDANVAYAVQLQRAQGWKPWVAHETGAYRKYLEA